MKKKPLSKVSPVQYSPSWQSRWVIADYGGKSLWKRCVLSLESKIEHSVECILPPSPTVLFNYYWTMPGRTYPMLWVWLSRHLTLTQSCRVWRGMSTVTRIVTLP